MFRKIMVGMVVLVLAGMGAVYVFSQGGHKYVGLKKCSMCHKAKAKGDQYGKWLDTAHAKAYETLGTEEAKASAAKVGVTGDPQKAPECLKCHVTAYGVDPSMLEKDYKMEDGVQCETCHGAGSDYMAMSVMKDTAKAEAAGLVVKPTEETCRKCHNEESPNFKGFDFKEYSAKISHPKP